MVFLFINIIACAALIWASFNIDTRYGIHKSTHPLINLVLLCATLIGLMALVMVMCFWAPPKLALIIAKAVFTLLLWFSVYSCMYLYMFPEFKPNKSITAVNWVLNAVVFVVFFFVPGAFSNVSITPAGEFEVVSNKVFSGALASFYPLTWFETVNLLYLVVIPFVSVIVTLVRSENMNGMLDRQRMRLCALGVFTEWLSLVLINIGARRIPLMWSLIMLCFIPQVLLFVRAACTHEIIDYKTSTRLEMRILFRFVIPAVVAGVSFYFIWPLMQDSKVLFFVAWTAANIAFNIVWYFITEFLISKDFMRDRKYEPFFEKALAAIKYEGNGKEIPQELFHAFHKYVTVSHMNIMLDSGEGSLETVWADDEKKFSIPFEDSGFDVLLNLKHPIVFREWLARDYNVAPAREQLQKILADTGAEAFILLNEGRRIVGLLLLYKKMDKNIYMDYDYKAFTKLYSHFFLAGYYMKNMMNESVVGTVNREIRMSGQIITSIQENMDLIKNTKVDAGYKMIPAHNIGGEFIDMIRLTDTRHIIVVGSMSGKGIAASMNMVILKSVIRTFLSEIKDFKKLVEKVNLFIRDELPKGSYFAGLFALIDFSTDTLYYINCGTPALFVYTKAYNNVIEVQGEGKILGFAKDIGPLIKVKKVKLLPGDVVVSCTDGLIETQSIRNEPFGKERVQRSLIENLMYPAGKIAQFTYDALVKFTSKELDDDITLFVMKYLGGSK